MGCLKQQFDLVDCILVCSAGRIKKEKKEGGKKRKEKRVVRKNNKKNQKEKLSNFSLQQIQV